MFVPLLLNTMKVNKNESISHSVIQEDCIKVNIHWIKGESF